MSIASIARFLERAMHLNGGEPRLTHYGPRVISLKNLGRSHHELMRSKYMPHQGQRECERRLRQIEVIAAKHSAKIRAAWDEHEYWDRRRDLYGSE